MIRENDYGESYAMIKAIFKHKSNNGHYYPFIYVDWFENTSREHIKVNCPLFILNQNTSRRKILSLTIVNEIRKAHFVYNCNARCQVVGGISSSVLFITAILKSIELTFVPFFILAKLIFSGGKIVSTGLCIPFASSFQKIFDSEICVIGNFHSSTSKVGLTQNSLLQ
ncbi:15488_t:CDS:2, partial [Dentiscutata erythropus]